MNDALVEPGTEWISDDEPPGTWLEENGQVVSRTTYADLFAKWGTRYGAGNGSTTFGIKDRRGRTGVGVGTGPGLTARSLGDSDGAETHSLSEAENGPHTHGIKFSVSGAGGVNAAVLNGSSGTETPTASTGSGAAHNNMQPWVADRYWVKA